jgi:carbon monoxide dehydrogenase subunit G
MTLVRLRGSLPGGGMPGMNFEGSLTLNAPAARVWEILLDANEVAACVPGAEEVKRIDDRTFDAVIKATVGPISGRFSFRAHIVESDPPRELVAHMDGVDSVTKSTVTGVTTVILDPLGENQTELSYASTLNVKGRLAILGEMVLRATTALMLEEVTDRLRQRVEGFPSRLAGDG